MFASRQPAAGGFRSENPSHRHGGRVTVRLRPNRRFGVVASMLLWQFSLTSSDKGCEKRLFLSSDKVITGAIVIATGVTALLLEIGNLLGCLASCLPKA